MCLYKIAPLLHTQVWTFMFIFKCSDLCMHTFVLISMYKYICIYMHVFIRHLFLLYAWLYTLDGFIFVIFFTDIINFIFLHKQMVYLFYISICFNIFYCHLLIFLYYFTCIVWMNDNSRLQC